ncbi:DNA mismatch repair protein MutS [Halobacteriovorax vibrionivorans]|uniref:DNA mismatch repair protein MutS n=1 Tax=Halobacteriovorax vibrionivorans TaxID=2152716 RepID=A0ABY0IHR6_9BACT|nr:MULTISPECIES: DNA mismatch repair protein MutS [Halobacteriovorax]RZF22499.1 DNA mismatch repair protein MutS [Halobacteriovorax vibrionivorans]TGD47691.1 DNA mismatch repair protein MutS [Halobacteriovorax sp. Y22]
MVAYLVELIAQEYTTHMGNNNMTLEIEKIVAEGVKLTPMMAQYHEIKTQYRDHMLMFRMGDFYEVFFEDAINASKILNIALTHRGKLGEHKIPMAGIPHHAAATYIDRFSKEGLKVAICEQVQDPKEAKGIVERAVTQVVSPGMPFDLDKTDSKEDQFIVACNETNGRFEIITIDFTTGFFKGFILETFEDFIEKLRVLAPKEFLTYLGQWDKYENVATLNEHNGTLVTHLSKEYFKEKYSSVYIEKLIPTYKRDQVIKENETVLEPIGALSYYICSTQNHEGFSHLHTFSLSDETGSMKVTIPTLTGLEILPKSRETYKESLLGFMDKTKTSMGSRKLKTIFTSPLTSKAEIKNRLDTIEYFLKNDELLQDTRESLNNVRDLERILAKAATNRANAGDLLNIASAVDVYEDLLNSLKKLPTNVFGKLNKEAKESLFELRNEIKLTINDEIGASLDKGNLIKEGANKTRDRLAKVSQNTAQALVELENRYREETGIQKLRIKSNNVAGYFIEVSKTHTDKVPANFVRRQTLVNSERYATEELTQFEKEVVVAREKLEKLEREIFKNLIKQITMLSNAIQNLANILSTTDTLQSLAWIARNEEFSRPTISDKSRDMDIHGAWHPLIKAAIKDQFIPHDLKLNEKTYFGLITGPNMAGKTTVMREIAIIQLLTQIGSYVPAENAKVSICDFLFSRLGASDDILKGQSTFMVEMAETAEILRHATENSLIILDEVGRGTSTYDGLSIAWALVEHFIEETKALCLFATHYHELIDLADSYPQAKNLTVETLNHKGNVKFLYRLIEKAASQSFGIYVAKLAGLPPSVLKRSQNVLKSMEKETNISKALLGQDETACGEQLDFFNIEVTQEVPDYLKQVEDDLTKMDINNLTPIQALNKLHQLVDQITFS